MGYGGYVFWRRQASAWYNDRALALAIMDAVDLDDPAKKQWETRELAALVKRNPQSGQFKRAIQMILKWKKGPKLERVRRGVYEWRP